MLTFKYHLVVMVQKTCCKEQSDINLCFLYLHWIKLSSKNKPVIAQKLPIIRLKGFFSLLYQQSVFAALLAFFKSVFHIFTPVSVPILSSVVLFTSGGNKLPLHSVRPDLFIWFYPREGLNIHVCFKCALMASLHQWCDLWSGICGPFSQQLWASLVSRAEKSQMLVRLQLIYIEWYICWLCSDK